MNLIEQLGIKVITANLDKVILEMPITDQVMQPFGVVHGGINGVLIETAAGVGANLSLTEGKAALGVDLQVNHLATAKSGSLIVTATPDKIGRRIQVWQGEIFNGEKKTAVGRCTVIVA
ncbi:PaaI family thioesterase [Enterococcus sp. LJL90]